ncbi:MAG: hypothetical protein KatS3mg085_549 [Candidatus Dojkabacteria bacterium]|nr:MAG: hypothetical protein KatS3mg085_549 [Candidatus Dojkabacteria bacterium]
MDAWEIRMQNHQLVHKDGKTAAQVQDHAGDPFCIKQENLLVVGRCPGCDNPSIIYRYCRQSVDLPGCYEQCNATFGCRDNLVCDTTRGVCVNPEFPDSPTCQAQSSTFCGNAICEEGELCERVEENSQTFRRCTALGAPPSGQLVANCRDILNSSNEPPTQYSCTFCGDGIRQSNEECDYAVDENCNLNCMFEESQTSMSIDKRILNEKDLSYW